MKGLDKPFTDRLLRCLEKVFSDEISVYVAGSRSNNGDKTPTEHSDLDLFVFGELAPEPDGGLFCSEYTPMSELLSQLLNFKIQVFYTSREFEDIITYNMEKLR